MVVTDEMLPIWHSGIVTGADAERAVIVEFIARQGGMQWLVEQIEAGDHFNEAKPEPAPPA